MRLAGGLKRPSLRYMGLLAIIFLAMAIMYVFQVKMLSAERGRDTTMRGLVRVLNLTDLCIATEARYTRNPAVTELTVAFQDHPGSLEHFPSGSFWAPPKLEK